RKDVLKGLMDASAPPARPDADPARDPEPARTTRGAIGAVSRSFADLKARAVVELDPHLIEAGGLQDRLETDAAAEAALRTSIAEYGQQVPVLVRPHPEKEGRYQIVYGRRRVLAMRDLGQPVKALMRDLDDRELVMAQGQENTARRDLSFIEKVNFARQMETHGYDRKVICDALSIDKTLVSRMLSVADRVAPGVIELIGSAPSVGRDRWLALADLIDQTDADLEDLTSMVNLTATSQRSDDRFRAAWTYLTGLRDRRRQIDTPPADTTAPIHAPDGLPLGQAKFDRSYCTLKLRLAATDGFEDWLLKNLPTLYADWAKNRPADPET
ncbi:MAG: plasmid partitioning protein RepB, partial [Gemmobacter sp.]|nr:plasmid partitioning protein RepB [Gemmobacter sp.]